MKLSEVLILGILSAVSLAASMRLHGSRSALSAALWRAERAPVIRVPRFIAYDKDGVVVSFEKGWRHLLASIPPPPSNAQAQIDASIWQRLAQHRVRVRAYCRTELCETSGLESAGIGVAIFAEWRTERVLATLFTGSPLVLIDEEGAVIGRTEWATLKSHDALQLWLSELNSR